MSDKDQQFQRRWEIRRTENDFDSSSDDDHLKSCSPGEPKSMKHKLANCQLSEENVQQTMHNPMSPPRGENHSSFEEPNRKPKQPGMTRERKATSRRTKKSTSNCGPSDAALMDLRGYMESLIEELNTAREDLLARMSKELNPSSTKPKGVIISTKPSGTRKGQRQYAKRSKTPRNNPNKSRGRSGTKTHNFKDGPSGRTSSQVNEKDIVPPKEEDNVFIAAKPVEKTEKQKGKKSRASTKKRKIDGTEAVEQTDKTSAAATDNCVTLSTVLPQKQIIKSERNSLEDGNGRDALTKNTLNSGFSLSSQHLNFDPRTQQNDADFAQNGLTNVSDYEENTSLTMGNGFSFPLSPQGLNGGIGMSNFSNQFGLPYLSQENKMPGMYREPPRYPNGNHTFMENYSALNQPLKFNVQQGGFMALQCPDIRKGAFSQGNTTSQ